MATNPLLPSIVLPDAKEILPLDAIAPVPLTSAMAPPAWRFDAELPPVIFTSPP
jgi:hypothetical protein